MRLSFIGSSQKNINLMLRDDMRKLEVVINFGKSVSHNNKTTYWCDDIKLFILYDTYFEHLRGKGFFR